MAVNSRIQALLDQRRASRYSGGVKTRVLTPSSTSGINAIARQTLNAETSAKIDQYNNGQIGNDEMLSFLNSQVSNPVLTPSEKVSITSQIADFQDKIKGDKLQANYTQAPNDSIAKVQAAQALKDYYQGRADSMVAGTPAQSQALENAGTWAQHVSDLNESFNKQARQTLRDQKMVAINAMPTGSSQQIQAKADLIKQLYDDANNSGDADAATAYAGQYNQLLQQIDTATTNETNKAGSVEKKTIVDQINTWVNDYHDNKIDANTLNKNLASIAPRVDATGDTQLQLSFNSTLDTVQKDIASGGLKRVQTADGLWAVTGKQGNLSVTGYDQSAFDYSDNIRLAQAMLVAGKDSKGNPYTPQMYAEDISHAITERSTLIQQQIADVEQVAQQNPNARVPLNGSQVKASDALDSLYKEQSSIQEQLGALQNDSAVLVEVPPKSGAELGSGKAAATFMFVDKGTLKDNVYAQDEQGVYHSISPEQKLISQSDYNDLVAAGDTTGITTDSAGNHYLNTGRQVVDIYEPGSANKITVPYESGKPVESWSSAKTRIKGEEAKNAATKIQQANQTEQQRVLPETKIAPSIPVGETQAGRVATAKASQQAAIENSTKLETQAKAGTLPPTIQKVEPLPNPSAPTIKPIQSSPVITATGSPTLTPLATKIVSQPALQNVGQIIQQNQVKPVASNLYINPSGNLSGNTPSQVPLNSYGDVNINKALNIPAPQPNIVQQAAGGINNLAGNIGKGINDLATKLNLKFW